MRRPPLSRSPAACRPVHFAYTRPAWPLQGRGRHGLYHRYNAALKRALANKSRAEMTLSELEAAVSWLERNRLADHLHLLDGDARYAWTARQRGEWRPPVGRADRRERRARSMAQ